MYLETASLDQKSMYKILIGSVLPRPIAWAGTRSLAGKDNLAPFSFYNAFSANPPIVGFSPIPRLDGSRKDTLQNVMETGCFTLNVVSYDLVRKMSMSSALLEPGDSEFDYAELTPVQAESINAPYVAESPIVFECVLQQMISFGDQPGAGNLILGKITHVRIADELYLENGRIDFGALDPVARLGGNFYSTLRDRFELERG
ncbi:MAG: flavin reductase family protein [Pseudomonadales bacterium]|nr:flavin reductase family protein [Pseudomonadales bacterium]